MAAPRLRITRVRVGPAVAAALLVTLATAGAAAAAETDTVGSYWRGLWWSVSLITTVGFVGEPPRVVQEEAAEGATMRALERVEARPAVIERQLSERTPSPAAPTPSPRDDAAPPGRS